MGNGRLKEGSLKETLSPHNDLISIYAKQQRCSGELRRLVKVHAQLQRGGTQVLSDCFFVPPESQIPSGV